MKHAGSAGGYGFGFIGAAVYYLQNAHSFGAVLYAIFKTFCWPAYLVYDLLKHLNG